MQFKNTKLEAAEENLFSACCCAVDAYSRATDRSIKEVLDLIQSKASRTSDAAFHACTLSISAYADLIGWSEHAVLDVILENFPDDGPAPTPSKGVASGETESELVRRGVIQAFADLGEGLRSEIGATHVYTCESDADLIIRRHFGSQSDFTRAASALVAAGMAVTRKEDRDHAAKLESFIEGFLDELAPDYR